MHLFALNQILAKVATCGCCFNCPSTVAWQPTQRAVEHIQQLQRGRAWRQAPRAMTLHFLTRPLLSLSLYLLLPFLGLLPIDYRGGRVHNTNNRRTGGGRREWGENEGKWEGGSGREAKEKGWTQSWEWMDRGAKIDEEAEVVHVLWTRWPVAPSVSLKPTLGRSTPGPFMSVTAGFPVQTPSHSQHYCYGKMKAFPETILYYAFPSNSIIIYSLFFSEWDSFKCVQGGWDRQAGTTLNLEPFQVYSLGERRPWWRNAWRLHKQIQIKNALLGGKEHGKQ